LIEYHTKGGSNKNIHDLKCFVYDFELKIISIIYV